MVISDHTTILPCPPQRAEWSGLLDCKDSLKLESLSGTMRTEPAFSAAISSSPFACSGARTTGG